MILVKKGDRVLFQSQNPKLRLRSHEGVLFVFRRGSKLPGKTFLSHEWTTAEYRPAKSELRHEAKSEMFRRLMNWSRGLRYGHH